MRDNRIARRLLLALAGGWPAAASAQGHWLVGRWEGEVTGGVGVDGPKRVMVVQSVAADGTVRGSWSFTGQGGGNASIRLDGDTVHVTSGRANTYTLRRVNPNRLEGEYVTGARGRAHAAWLVRQ
jgi:hypothetical protein